MAKGDNSIMLHNDFEFCLACTLADNSSLVKCPQTHVSCAQNTVWLQRVATTDNSAGWQGTEVTA